jgi:hypothetical protein
MLFKALEGSGLELVDRPRRPAYANDRHIKVAALGHGL